MAISACRPAVDDNGTGASDSTGSGSVSSGDLQDKSVPPAKLSQAYLPLSGGTMTGVLTLAGAPSGTNDAATKGYVDGLIAAGVSDGAVSTSKIASDAVTSAKILDGEIVNADISATAAISLSKLAAGTEGQTLQRGEEV